VKKKFVCLCLYSFKKKLFQLLFSLILLISSGLLSCVPARAYGFETVAKLVDLFKGFNTVAIPANILQKASQFIDYKSMAEQALGREQWSKLSKSEKDRFCQALQKLIEERYYPRWHKLFSKGQLICDSESLVGSRLTIKSHLTINDNSQNIIWQLDNKTTPAKVLSIQVGEKNLLAILHARLLPRLQKSGIKSLISWLDSKSSRQTATD
jgi:ABC-type transporter MlaC component